MVSKEQWDWTPGKKDVANLEKIMSEYDLVTETTPSPDGEKIAVVAKNDDEEFVLSQNGEEWPEAFEKIWQARYLPSGKLVGFAMTDDEWGLAIDGEMGEELFEFAWNPVFSPDGESYAYMTKMGMKYGIVHNGEPWEESFMAIRDLAISEDGQHVAVTAQTEKRKEADIDGFFKGMWSVAVDGALWDSRFVGVWGPCFNHDNSAVAAQVRTGNAEYGVAVNGKAWEQNYPAVWETIFRPGTENALAPVRTQGNWTMAENGKLLWSKLYAQLWHESFSPDGKRLAAVGSPEFGKWSVIVDDSPWKLRWDDMVLPPIFSPDSRRVGAVVKSDDHWGIAVDDEAWNETFPMVWDPVFSPDSRHVAAKVEKDGKYAVMLDGRLFSGGYEQLWEPVFSPDSQYMMLRYVSGGVYTREIVAVAG